MSHFTLHLTLCGFLFAPMVLAQEIDPGGNKSLNRFIYTTPIDVDSTSVSLPDKTPIKVDFPYRSNSSVSGDGSVLTAVGKIVKIKTTVQSFGYSSSGCGE